MNPVDQKIEQNNTLSNVLTVSIEEKGATMLKDGKMYLSSPGMVVGFNSISILY